ncbi:hypothetical protein [Deinococcus sp. SL84]|uniref:hypothetical protein n=1 Tax=Deinococcus sp. SL84 TaxID=2994663 RepID=UPI002275433C|nr:hypothetical protein [Deinococcus sp. SL84]MCY1703854.1 hypothetical protein [Deinococcus sp. SL84]
MDKLHPYVWELYGETPGGQAMLDYFSRLPTAYRTSGLYLEVLNGADHLEEVIEAGSPMVPPPPDVLDFIEGVKAFAQAQPASSPEQARELLHALVSEDGPSFLVAGEAFQLDEYLALDNLHLISLALHLAHPEVFVPYGFQDNYWAVEQMAREFAIALPPIPPKRDFKARWLYFSDYSQAFQNFRIEHGMNLPELLAFMNDFAPLYLTRTDETLPEPLNAWLLIGNSEEDGAKGHMDYLIEQGDQGRAAWQGNLNMRRGDVVLMYLYSPLKQLYALGRVVEDGYLSPFFHYKQAVQVGHFQRVPPLSYQELSSGPVMSRSGLVARRMQGASGALLTREEYQELMEALIERGLDPAQVPALPVLPSTTLEQLGSERDVELQLVEPLLERLGLTDEDWVRQMPVRMGRGERYYPDYVLGVTGDFPEQRVQALIEVKYRTPHERDWKEAFWQAQSYALRLQAKTLMVISADGLRVYQQRQGNFAWEQGWALTWEEVSEAQVLTQLRRVLT